MDINTSCNIFNFRRFIIQNTCKDLIPTLLFNDSSVFPERDAANGLMYVEAKDKETIGHVREIHFVRVQEPLEVIYTSKSGNTHFKWRMTGKGEGKLIGKASLNSLVNLVTCKVISGSELDLKDQEKDT